MDASSVQTPEALAPPDRSAEQSAEESEPDEKQPSRDTVLLVEDNAINMRVRRPATNLTSGFHEAIVRTF
jgi:hypothetical protein